MSKKLKILFISHEASSTGAPLFLLGLHTWLQQNMGIESVFLLKVGGTGKDKFSSYAKTYLWDLLRPKHGQHLRFLVNRIRKFVIAMLLKFHRFDLVYLNSVSSCDILPTLKGFGVGTKVILHVHELDKAIDSYHAQEFRQAIPMVDHFIAVSEQVRNSLIHKWNIPAKQVSLIHPCVFEREGFIRHEKIRQKLNIPEGTFVIGSCGEMGDRKGTDLFIQCARDFFNLHPQANAVFVWLGDCRQKDKQNRYSEMLKQYGLTDKVLFAGRRVNAGDYFHAFDLFLLTSREDPFPLVAIENGIAGNPIICFDQHNGCIEYVNSECGDVVAYEQTDLMAKAVERFYSNRNDMVSASPLIKQQVEPYSPDTTGNAIKDLLNSMQQTGEV